MSTEENTIRPFLTFYDQLGFAPTRQSLQTSSGHKTRRSFLYRQLGLPEFAISGSDVIEFRPGSGENSEALLALKPRSYTFVDGSEVVIQNLQERMAGWDFSQVELGFHSGDVLDVSLGAKYDLVVCEGLVPMQIHPKKTARNVLDYVRIGGCVVLTCFDSVSAFSEIARRFIASTTFGELVYTPKLIEELVEFFTPDFNELPGMTRRPEDWVLDSIFNPWIGEFFSLEDALDVGREDFDLLGTSPRMLQDWRWYKDPSVQENKRGVEIAIDSYREALPSLLDCRISPYEGIKADKGFGLRARTQEIAHLVREHISNGVVFEAADFGSKITEMMDAAPFLDEKTTSSLRSLIAWSESRKVSDLSGFRGLWGRGQQYISLVRLM